MSDQKATRTMHVLVSRVDGALFDGDAFRVTAPGVEGTLTILPEHEAYITPLQEGNIQIEGKDGVTEVEVKKGLMEVSNDQISIIL